MEAHSITFRRQRVPYALVQYKTLKSRNKMLVFDAMGMRTGCVNRCMSPKLHIHKNTHYINLIFYLTMLTKMDINIKP